MKLDIFNHFFPRAFYDRMIELSPKGKDINKRVREVPSIVDLDKRLRIVDQFDDYQQVICLPAPALEDFGKHSVEMAKLGNDGMAELVAKHRDHFPAFIAGLPMNEPDALLKDRKSTRLNSSHSQQSRMPSSA